MAFFIKGELHDIAGSPEKPIFTDDEGVESLICLDNVSYFHEEELTERRRNLQTKQIEERTTTVTLFEFAQYDARDKYKLFVRVPIATVEARIKNAIAAGRTVCDVTSGDDDDALQITLTARTAVRISQGHVNGQPGIGSYTPGNDGTLKLSRDIIDDVGVRIEALSTQPQNAATVTALEIRNRQAGYNVVLTPPAGQGHTVQTVRPNATRVMYASDLAVAWTLSIVKAS